MREYVIDGNNVLHLDKQLAKVFQKNPQSAREKLAFMTDRYFSGKNVAVTLFFDGFEKLPIRTDNVRIRYSGNKIADTLIRNHIENSTNPRNLTAVSNDDEIKKLAQACSASLMSSSDFITMIKSRDGTDEDEKNTRGMSNEEFKKLFGVDED